jgi:hypothetical protein
MFTECFVVEEAVFRGDIDTYLAPPPELVGTV